MKITLAIHNEIRFLKLITAITEASIITESTSKHCQHWSTKEK